MKLKYKKILYVALFDWILTIIIIPFLQTKYDFSFFISAGIAALLISVSAWYIYAKWRIELR